MYTIGYVRVSNPHEQGDNYSIPAQRRDYETWIARHNHTDLGTFEDKQSAYRKAMSRPAFGRALALVRTGVVEAVWVKWSSRFGRDDSMTDDVLDEFERLGVRLIVDGVEVDRSTPSGWVQHKITSVFDEHYSRLISFHASRGLREKAEQGKAVGKLPYGYDRGPDHILVPNADAPTVQRMFAMIADGTYTINSTCDTLNREGITAVGSHRERTVFKPTSLSRILHNRVYLGFVRSGGVEYQGRHTPLIDQATWDAAQQAMERRVTWRGVRHDHQDALLAGALWCVTCGSKCWVIRPTRYHTRYHCSNRACTERHASAKATTTDAQLWAWLANFVLPAEIVDAAIARAKQLVADTYLDAPPSAAMQTIITARQQRVKKLYLAGRLSDAEFEEEWAASDRIDTTPSVRRLHIDVERARTLLAHLPHYLETEHTMIEQRAFIHALFERVWVQQQCIVAVTPHAATYPLLAGLAAIGMEYKTSV